MPLLSTRSLTKRFPGVAALDDLTLQLEPGIIGLVGANGAGKSTLLKILLGLMPPTTGTATVLGLDVVADAMALRSRLGYTPEYDCLPADQSATEFVTHLARISGLPRTAARERAAEMLRHVGLHEERYRLIGSYSTGMKQRVKLAQALVHDPQLVLLDEPTNGLDPAGRDDMLDLIHRTGTEFGISLIVTSHLLSEVERVCSMLVVIEGGRLRHAAPIGDFTRELDGLHVEVYDSSDALCARLVAQGIAAQLQGETVVVASSDTRTCDAVRDAVASLGLALVRQERRRHRLEEIFTGAASGRAEAHGVGR